MLVAVFVSAVAAMGFSGELLVGSGEGEEGEGEDGSEFWCRT